MAFTEITVSPTTPMPNGYKFLKKGYPFMTALCRRKTRAAGRTLYVVRAGSQTLGLRCPSHILRQVYEEERGTRAERRAAVCVRDEAARETFRAAMFQEFPGMPRADVERVLRRALAKRSGRVGRTATLRIEDKVRLAVAAHVRHVYTDYDVLVRGERTKEEARKMVFARVGEVLEKWRGREGCNGGEEENMDGDDDGSDSHVAPWERRRQRQQRQLRTDSDEERVRTRSRATRGTTTTVGELGHGGEEAAPLPHGDVIEISSDSEEDQASVMSISSDDDWLSLDPL